VIFIVQIYLSPLTFVSLHP